MKHTNRITSLFLALMVLHAGMANAQNTIKEYVADNDPERMEKNVVMGGEPITAKGFGDGHGKMPLLTKKSQLPDTVALITFYMYDLGTNTTSRAGHSVNTVYTSVSKNGGNTISNEIYRQSISNLKAAFKKRGVVLLTPDEFLNTPARRTFYYKEFAPEVSKLGKFLSNIESKQTDIEVSADSFRVFDLTMATDHLRSESLGSELAKKLGVNGVMSIAVELQSSKKSLDLHGFKVSLHGPNPIPKEDKKYVAQKMGNGYYEGQLYSYGTLFLKNPVRVGAFKKAVIEELDFEGVGSILEAFVNKFYDTMGENAEKAAKKYD
jgi:hypothetical protein